MSKIFSSIYRSQIIGEAAEEHFDLLVVGGGVTGCGIALDAASRGLKTFLIEKGDFASGTSSKSTKLIHGGLRYLKQMEIKLVRDAGTERAIVNRLAPHLVRPEKMLLPLVKDGSFGKLSTSLGLRLYDWLAKVKPEDKRKMLSREETLEHEPLLRSEMVLGGGYYAEYRTDDARLTIELIKQAVHLGASAVNYCEVFEFMYDRDRINGVRCRDHISGRIYEFRADHIVSAAGPWVDHLRRINDSLGNRRLHLTKGVHLVVPHKRLPVKQSVYFDAPDDRMIFAIPRNEITYIGTTDTTFTGDLDRVVATVADRDYLISAVNRLFEGVNLKSEDVISNWAGVRPLIHQEGKSPSEISRKDEIFRSEDGLISIAGGKLTGYRLMAKKIVDLLCGYLDESGACVFKDSMTDQIPLCGDCIGTNEEVEKYIEEVSKRISSLGLERTYGPYLVTTYGRQLETILQKMSEAEEVTDEVGLALAEAWFAMRYEMTERASDFFVRRTGRLFFNPASVNKLRIPVVNYMQQVLGWSEERRAEEEKILDRHLYDATHYYEEDLKDKSTS